MDITVIGQRIKLAREAAHITQEQLANSVGCTPQHIGAIERGVKTPRLDTFVTIANAMGTSADLLLQDVLDRPVDSLAGEISAAISPLSPKTQRCVLNALRAFSDGED